MTSRFTGVDIGEVFLEFGGVFVYLIPVVSETCHNKIAVWCPHQITTAMGDEFADIGLQHYTQVKISKIDQTSSFVFSQGICICPL